jgi:2-hydroxy-3-keto-5-methylthiopentenyl-1-phosphate phosphatase
MKLAIIDFDGTLFPRDTIPFLMNFWLEDGQSRLKHKLTMAKIMPYYYLYKLSFGNKKIKEGFRTHALKMFNASLMV